ncbi:LysR family transcriptional regulator [uncultured Ruegeria sp.]|uniref:LysR family transcriptional regulator n=1 Tax=uncultured Ruegeria sp. TaxID=259304 RepID=UPI002608F69F|nr:LysR family transcriptional regulator [uncultured Ruegeria sp.]
MPLHLVPRVLHYLEEVARSGSIQAASRELGISASAVHRQITLIEEDLGDTLFVRGNKGMALTPAGQMVIELARNWRLDNSRLWNTIQANKGVESPTVKIAAMDGMVNGYLPNMVDEICRKYPQAQLEVEVTSPDSAVNGVLNGDYDVAAVVNPFPHDDLKIHWSRAYPLGCVAVPSHPVAKLDSISLVEFARQKIVFQSVALSVRRLLESRHSWIFSRAENSVVVNSIQLMKLLVQSGKYVAVTSELDAGPEIEAGQLVFVPVEDEDLFKQRFALVSNRQLPESATMSKVISIAADVLNRQPIPVSKRHVS